MLCKNKASVIKQCGVCMLAAIKVQSCCDLNNLPTERCRYLFWKITLLNIWHNSWESTFFFIKTYRNNIRLACESSGHSYKFFLELKMKFCWLEISSDSWYLEKHFCGCSLAWMLRNNRNFLNYRTNYLHAADQTLCTSSCEHSSPHLLASPWESLSCTCCCECYGVETHQRQH